jgi:hypothetical protein
MQYRVTCQGTIDIEAPDEKTAEVRAYELVDLEGFSVESVEEIE